MRVPYVRMYVCTYIQNRHMYIHYAHTANVSPGVTLISNVGPSYRYTQMMYMISLIL